MLMCRLDLDFFIPRLDSGKVYIDFLRISIAQLELLSQKGKSFEHYPIVDNLIECPIYSINPIFDS